jgi:hypothetical protein
MKPLWIATAATLLSSGGAVAQVGGIGTAPIAPLGVTSPLGLGPGTAVGPIGIPDGTPAGAMWPTASSRPTIR